MKWPVLCGVLHTVYLRCWDVGDCRGGMESAEVQERWILDVLGVCAEIDVGDTAG